MSSEEESNTSSQHHNHQQQPLRMRNCVTVAGKDYISSTAPPAKKRRNLPGNPDPDAEVVALSPRTLLATNRYICEACRKGFQRDQNLQLHRRGHNLPWKLKQRTTMEVKKQVYVCPEVTCTHHDPGRALGDLTGIKKHYSRKHGEKKWNCDKFSKRYAVQSDWKAHAKICRTKEYRCDCGTIFSRKDSFITHRAFCDALAEEKYRSDHGLAAMVRNLQSQPHDMFSSPTMDSVMNSSTSDLSLNPPEMIFNPTAAASCTSGSSTSLHLPMDGAGGSSSYMSATALLQKAVEMGAKVSDDDSISPILLCRFTGYSAMPRPANNSVREGSNGISSTFAPMMLPVSGGMQVSENNNNNNNNNNNCEEVGEGRDVRMTQDFLGLGPMNSYGEQNGVGLSYSNGQQGNPAGMYSYQQHISHEPNGMEKPMWEF